MKRIIKNILIFISYFIYSNLIKAILYLLNINYLEFQDNYKVLTTFIIEISYILLISFLYRKEIKKDILDFKENYKTYLSKYILIYLLGIVLMTTINIILSKITNNDMSTNESIIRLYIKEYPLYMTFSSIIFAPFVEELIFRKAIRNIFKNRYLFIIISGIIFGVLHIYNLKDINEILYGIPYIIMGLDFAYIYHKTNNIFTTMTFHFCHNLILLLIQLL